MKVTFSMRCHHYVEVQQSCTYQTQCLVVEDSQEREEEREMNFEYMLTESLEGEKEGFEAESEKSYH